MYCDISPRHSVVAAGQPAVITLTITNTRQVIVGCSIRVLGADASWIAIDEPEPRLFPDETITVIVQVTIPAELPAGARTLSIQVQDLADPAHLSIEEITLDVPSDPRLHVTVDPSHITAGKRAHFTTVVTNAGNAVQEVTMAATDPKAKTTFDFQPAAFRLDPGASMPVVLRVKARRRLLGDAVLRPFQVDAHTEPEPETPTPPATAVFVQKSLFSRGALSLVGLLLAVTVFAIVIVIALSSVVNRSAADRNLALAVAQARDSAPTSGQASITGSVTDLMTGAAVSGVSVAAFSSDDTNTAVASNATSSDGNFTMSGMPAGDYLVRVQGAGYDPVWYPAAASPGDASEVTVTDGSAVTGLTLLVGGIPASLSGTVTGTDVSGATLTLQLPLDEGILADAGLLDETATGPIPAGAVVTSVPIASDGAFEIKSLPAPAVYDLIVTKEGLAPTVQRLDVAAGEDRSDVVLSLLTGDGIIEGTVTGADGPIGEATVVATSQDVTVRTVSLTEGEIGDFVLRGLPTPGTYTITVSADGYSDATLSLALSEGQQLTGVSAVLGSATGSLGGRVSVDVGSAGGVEVTISDGSTTVRTVTQSTRPVGQWQVTGLRIPSTYTVTFSRQGLTSQVLSVHLDGFGQVTQGAPNATSVNARLSSATASLSGTVRQARPGQSATPVGNVTITLSSGDTQRVVTSASTPAGQVGYYEIDDLRPGTYTVTFTRPGTTASSTIITLTAGEAATHSPTLVAPASISGTVTQAITNAPAPGLTVNLYFASEYGTAAGPVATTTTSSDGKYSFIEVDAPEHYIVEIRTAPGGTVVATSRPISLAASDTHVYDATI